MKFFAIFAFVLLGLALAFGQTVSPSPAAVVVETTPVLTASISPVVIATNVTTTVSPVVVATNAPTYYKVIYTSETSAAAGLAPFKFF